MHNYPEQRTAELGLALVHFVRMPVAWSSSWTTRAHDSLLDTPYPNWPNWRAHPTK